MKVERKQISVKVLAEVLVKMQAIQEETGLSQAKVIEMLVNNYKSTSENTSTSESLAKPLVLDEEKLLVKLQEKMLVLIKEEVQAQLASINEEDEEEPFVRYIPNEMAQTIYGSDIPPIHKNDVDEWDLAREIATPEPKPKHKKKEEDHYDMF